MTRYIAFLRAINVGGHVVKMDFLRPLFESMGLGAVQTYIASGNVIFEAQAEAVQALEQAIAARLHEALGYDVATFIRTAAEVAEIARYEPFAADELAAPGVSLYVGLAAAALGADAQRTLMSFRTPVDDFHVHERDIYWLCRIRSSDSDFSLARFEKATRVQATFRNITTLRKLAALYGGE
jgi:uncharacterized protein (DUF1697 family)